MPIRYAIKDLNVNKFYQQHPIRSWYGDLDGARMYARQESADKIIKSGNHHVTFPGGRNLRVVRINITEEPDLE